MNRKVLVTGLALALPLIVILLANIGRDPHSISSPLIGHPAPEFSLVPVGGGDPVALSALRGHPAVVNFWATWCIPCVEENATLMRAAQQLKGDVQFLGVVYEDTEAPIAAFLRQHGEAYPSLLDVDGKTAIAYGVYGVPETYFIDAQGTIVAKFVGPLDPATLDGELRKARGGVR
jgi:cytochrome c biogenesis protein CcmG, thiol:disulfide interchange protein DsbE